MKPTDETRVVEAAFVAGAVDEASLPPPTLVEVAFAGRSNVGKSTLLNAMMDRRGLARTSNTPGCTTCAAATASGYVSPTCPGTGGRSARRRSGPSGKA